MYCKYKGCTNLGVASVLKKIDGKTVQLSACEKFEGDTTHWITLSTTFDEEELKRLFNVP